jgi:glycosyltransferase involved in cell wall biosynthesis
VGLLPNQSTGRQEDAQPDGTYRFKGLPYWPLCRSRPGSRFERYLQYFTGKPDARLDWLARKNLASVKILIVYPGVWGTVALLLRLRRLCRIHKIRLLVHVVEWQAPNCRGGLAHLMRALDGEAQRRWLNPHLDGVICVSEYLKNYYDSHGVRAALIPPLVDLTEPVWRSSAAAVTPPHRPVRLLFSGRYSRDRQDNLLKAVKAMRECGGEIVLEYLGASKENIADLTGVGVELVNSLGDGVRFHGKVPDQQVHGIVASATFGVLLREDAPWSKACFPSKVAEFSALGVPMLCNLTSDLAHYLKHGENAVIVQDTTVDAVCAALRQVLSLTSEQMLGMRQASRETATRFDGCRHAVAYRNLLT